MRRSRSIGGFRGPISAAGGNGTGYPRRPGSAQIAYRRITDSSFEAGPLEKVMFGTKAQKDESGHGEFQAKEKFAKILVFRKQEPAVVPRPSQHLCVGCARCNLCHVQ